MKHNLHLALIAAFCAACGTHLAGEALAGSPMRAAATQNTAPLQRHLNTQGMADRGQTILRVDTCKRRRFYNPGVFLDGGLDYLDPNYGEMNHGECLDPPPRRPHRLSCRDVREILRERGYRRIRTRDCKGNIYNFNAYLGSRRYKLRVRSKNGSIKSRARI